MNQRILELKARAYDLIAQIEHARNELQAVNAELTRQLEVEKGSEEAPEATS